MMTACICVGIITGLIVAQPFLKLHLGLSGHRALFWMTPVLTSRLVTRFKAGSTLGALSAAFATFIWGGNLAGGLVGLPLIALVAFIFDFVINRIENYKVKPLLFIPLLGLAAMAGNLIMFSKRLLMPAGPAGNSFLGMSGFLFDMLSYAIFGLLAGVSAAVAANLINLYRSRNTK